MLPSTATFKRKNQCFPLLALALSACTGGLVSTAKLPVPAMLFSQQCELYYGIRKMEFGHKLLSMDINLSATKHTHTHPFNGPFSRTTRVSQYQ